MRLMTASETRTHFRETLDRVVDDCEPVVVTRAAGKGEPVVMLSLREYESMVETAYLMSNPANARRLLDSIAELNAGKGEVHELIEP